MKYSNELYLRNYDEPKYHIIQTTEEKMWMNVKKKMWRKNIFGYLVTKQKKYESSVCFSESVVCYISCTMVYISSGCIIEGQQIRIE